MRIWLDWPPSLNRAMSTRRPCARPASSAFDLVSQARGEVHAESGQSSSIQGVADRPDSKHCASPAGTVAGPAELLARTQQHQRPIHAVRGPMQKQSPNPLQKDPLSGGSLPFFCRHWPRNRSGRTATGPTESAGTNCTAVPDSPRYGPPPGLWTP